MSNLRTLPIWKKDASAAERLSELSLLAQEKPERFDAFVIVYKELLPNGNWKIRTMDFNVDLAGQLGLLHLGQDEIMESSRPQ